MLIFMIKSPIINHVLKCMLKIAKKSVFLKRSLEYSQFTNRCSSVSHKNPPKWKQLSIDGVCRVRILFKEENVDAVLSVDETFLRFHECTKKVLAPIGVKRVGVALSDNEKNGSSVMITLDMFANKALAPFIIFTGVFGALLMNEYKEMTKATVLFTDTHWMTSATNMLYFKYLSNFYKGKK